MALQTQDVVRKEWATQGLGFSDTPEYQACMDRVCDRMGVSTKGIVQTHRGRVWMEGARKLGWEADVRPQNSGGKQHSCGHCTMCCGSVVVRNRVRLGAGSLMRPRLVLDSSRVLQWARQRYASVFSSAAWVNPMVTVMAIADWIARAVNGDVKGVDVEGRGARGVAGV